MPPNLKLVALSDQSVFVRAAIGGVIREGVIAAALTGLLILLFLGSWRSTLIITISIPLSILASIACLAALGETINIMTLGGLALAVGILVDDATVTIENINFNLEQGKDVEPAILDGAHQIALPALVSTLSICIVFVPMFQLAGIAKYLFIPLAEAVVFAMLASYLLSRTLIPTLAKFWLKRKDEDHNRSKSAPARFQEAFERRFEHFRAGYRKLLELAVDGGARFAVVFLLAMAAAALLAFPIGPLSRIGPGFLPDGRCRTAEIAPAGEHRNAYRGNRHPVRSSGENPARHHPAERDHLHRRQLGAALQRHQSRLQHLRAGRTGRCRYLHQLRQETLLARELSARIAHEIGGHLTPRRNSRSCPPTSSVRF